MGAALAGVHCVLTMVWFNALILGGGMLAGGWLIRRRCGRLTGLVLVALGGKLITDS